MRDYKIEWEILYLMCTKCWKRLTIDSFHKDKSKDFGVRTTCKECKKETSKKYYIKNRSNIIDYVSMRQQKNKEIVDWYKRNYRENNKEKVADCQKKNKETHSKELWYNRDTFHQKAIKFVKKHWLRPKKCPICWLQKKVVMHHPYYDSYEDWNKIVFCCQSCHKKIHSWIIICPPIVYLIK